MPSLREILEKAPPEQSPDHPGGALPTRLAGAIDDSIAYLNSPAAAESLAKDPYWPKWNSPWWHVLLFNEMGMAESLPSKTIESIAGALAQYYLKCFPSREEDVPAGIDPLNQIPCHCQLGTIEQVFQSCGKEGDPRLNWLSDWYLNYQLPDGGLNCDESAYNKAEPKSSIVSTLPPMEALLARENLSASEVSCLDRGAQYLLERKLHCRKNSDQVIDQNFLQLAFPRFYHYDILRGLSFIVAWAKKLSRPLPVAQISEVILLIDGKFPDGHLKVERQVFTNCQSRFPGEAGEAWHKGEATSFPLLEAVSQIGEDSPFLTAKWATIKRDLQHLERANLLHT